MLRQTYDLVNYVCFPKDPDEILNIADFHFHARSGGGFMHDGVRLHCERQRRVLIQQ